MIPRVSIYYSKPFFKKRFMAKTMKKAYMDACKWYATVVLSRDELHNVQVEFEKRTNEDCPTVVLHLFAVMDEEELRKRHCAICQECHSAFYMRSKAPCERCEVNAYQSRTDDMLRVKLEYYGQLVRKAAKANGDDVDEEESTGQEVAR